MDVANTNTAKKITIINEIINDQCWKGNPIKDYRRARIFNFVDLQSCFMNGMQIHSRRLSTLVQTLRERIISFNYPACILFFRLIREFIETRPNIIFANGQRTIFR